MSSPRSLRWQLNAWTLVALAVFMFGVAMLITIARDGADAIGWALIVGITLGSAAAVSWLISMRTRLH